MPASTTASGANANARPGTAAAAANSSSSTSAASSLGRFLDLHSIWALGHFILLAASTRIVVGAWGWLFGGRSYGAWYKLAYAGALLSYTIVVQKSIGLPRSLGQLTSAAYLQRLLMDDNVQYALLAAYWFVSGPVYLSLLPFATFSLFHCLTFTRTNVLPKLAPHAASSSSSSSARPQPGGNNASAAEVAGRRIHLWVKGNYDGAMRFVAKAELAILAWTVVRAVTFRGSFLAPIFLAHFLRVRYLTSPFTRSTVSGASSALDRWVARPGRPPVVRQGWELVKRLVSGWMGGVGAAAGGPQAQAQGPAAANAQAARR